MGVVSSCGKRARSMTFTKVYRAVSSTGRARGTWRLSRAQAEAEGPESGSVEELPAVDLMQLKRIPWRLVDLIWSTGTQGRSDGIDEVYRTTQDLRILERAYQALVVRGRR